MSATSVPFTGDGFCGPSVVVLVVVDDVVVVELDVVVDVAAVVETGGSVVIAVDVVVSALSPLQAAATSAKTTKGAARLMNRTAGVYLGFCISDPRVGWWVAWESMDRIDFVAGELGKLANAQNAAAMAAYMKTDMPFFGVKRPDSDPIFKEMMRRYPVTSRRDYEAAVKGLWEQPHREEKYFAIGVARAAEEYITPPSLPLYRKLIIEGAWWDFVDDVAANLVGQLLLEHRSRIAPIMEKWIDDRNMWIRRSALLAHLKHKEATDEATLFDHCLRRAHEPEFFIRKAIGWVLRQYARSAPDAVAEFVIANRDSWSGLTFREATKHLDVD